DAVLLGHVLNVSDHLLHLTHGGGLGDRDVGQVVSGTADQNIHVLSPKRIGEVVDAGPSHLVLVQRSLGHAHDHLGVLLLLAGGGSVFAVHGDVEDAAFGVLQLHGLRDEFFRTGEVLAGGDDGKGLLAREKGFVGVLHDSPRSSLAII